MKKENNKDIKKLDLNNLRETKLNFVIESTLEIEEKINNLKVQNDYFNNNNEKSAEKYFEQLPHRHDYFTIIYIINATGKHYINFKEYDVTPNSLFFLNPNHIHLLNLDKNPLGYVIMFKNELISNNENSELKSLLNYIFNDSENYYNFGNCNNSKLMTKFQKVIELMNLHYKEYEISQLNSIDNINETNLIESIEEATIDNSNDLKTFELIFSKLTSLLLIYSKELIVNHNKENAFNRNSEIYENFVQILNNKYKENHNVNYYAKLLNLSADYLSKILKEVSGKSAKELIIEKLILEAKSYAFNTNCSLKEISYHLGFNDEVQFSKFFSKNAQISFVKFKKMYLKK